MFSTDGEGDAGCLQDFGVSLTFSSPAGGHISESGVGVLKLGPSISYEPNGGRGDATQLGFSVTGGAGGLGVSGTYSSPSTDFMPEGFTLEGGVIFAAAANKTKTFSLSVGDLGRLLAAVVTGDYSQRIFGVNKSSDSCGCEK